MSRGVPASNLVRRAIANIKTRFADKKAAREGLIAEVRKEQKLITGSITSSIDAFLARRRVFWRMRGKDRMPHQGKRECARRRGDWAKVSVIDALKRYPYGINHRFPSQLRPDRVEVDFAKPERLRIVLPR